MATHVGTHGTTPEVPAGSGRGRRLERVNGVILTVFATVGLVAAAAGLVGRFTEDHPTVRKMQTNEVRAMQNLVRIRDAQADYRDTDWDGDGFTQYAAFYAHLWASVGAEGDRIRVGLIPKRLAFAAGSYRTLRGYFFRDLHIRESVTGDTVDLDYASEWAVLGEPARDGITGVCVFLADHTGTVYVTKTLDIPDSLPLDPEAEGWVAIESVKDLRDYQSSISYYVRR